MEDPDLILTIKAVDLLAEKAFSLSHNMIDTYLHLTKSSKSPIIPAGTPRPSRKLKMEKPMCSRRLETSRYGGLRLAVDEIPQVDTEYS